MNGVSLPLLLAGLVLAASPGAALAAEAADAGRIQGTWAVVSAVVDGQADKERWPETTMTIKNDKITFTNKKNKKEESHQFKLDPGKKPKAIDFLPGKDETVLGIYELEGKTLKFCIQKSGQGGRPVKFASSPHDGHTLVVFERKP